MISTGIGTLRANEAGYKHKRNEAGCPGTADDGQPDARKCRLRCRDDTLGIRTASETRQGVRGTVHDGQPDAGKCRERCADDTIGIRTANETRQGVWGQQTTVNLMPVDAEMISTCIQTLASEVRPECLGTTDEGKPAACRHEICHKHRIWTLASEVRSARRDSGRWSTGCLWIIEWYTTVSEHWREKCGHGVRRPWTAVNRMPVDARNDVRGIETVASEVRQAARNRAQGTRHSNRHIVVE